MKKSQSNVLYTYIDMINPEKYKGGLKYKVYKPVVIGRHIKFSSCTAIVPNEYLEEKNLCQKFDLEAMSKKQKEIISQRIKANKLIEKFNKNNGYPLISFFISSIFYLALGGMFLNLILL